MLVRCTVCRPAYDVDEPNPLQPDQPYIPDALGYANEPGPPKPWISNPKSILGDSSHRANDILTISSSMLSAEASRSSAESEGEASIPSAAFRLRLRREGGIDGGDQRAGDDM